VIDGALPKTPMAPVLLLSDSPSIPIPFPLVADAQV
jgi:hypothetical protein